jgi:hypothetical protein
MRFLDQLGSHMIMHTCLCDPYPADEVESNSLIFGARPLLL